MTEISKQPQPKTETKPEEPKKAEAALSEKQLDQVTGGRISQACATGKHFPTVTITN